MIESMDAHGRVPLLDTATDEVRLVYAGVAQEIIERNPDGRYEVAPMHTPANPADARKLAQLQSIEGPFTMSDATDVTTAPLEAPTQQPRADRPPTAAVVAGDPDKLRAQAEKDDAGLKARAAK